MILTGTADTWVMHGRRGVVVLLGRRLLLGVLSVSVVSLVLLGGANDRPSAWRVAVVVVAVCGIVGMTVVAAVRHRKTGGRDNELPADLDQLAHTDALTGLADRDAWQFELDRDLARARRTGDPVSIALIDIDSFTSANAVAGDPGRDSLLSTIAHGWIEVLRPEDVLARLDGHEFAVLISGCSHFDAGGVVTRLQARMPRPHSCSIGLATWDTLELADQLIRRAGNALYDAQRDSRRQAAEAERDRAGAGSVARSYPTSVRPCA